jgi:hypothetical protein
MYWWWDEYIDPLGLWKNAKGIQVLIGGTDLSSLAPRKFAGPKYTYARALVGASKTLVWIRHKNYSRDARIKLTTAELIKALKENRKPRPIGDPVVAATKVKVPVSSKGTFLVHVMLTKSGKVLSTRTLTTTGKLLTVNLPSFKGDIAVRVTRK